MMRALFISIIGIFALVGLVACNSSEKTTRVVMQTGLGVIEIDVYKSRAPLTAENFLYYVDNDLYDAQGFYRAVRPKTDPRGLDMQIIQGGLLSMESVTAPIDHETTEMSGLSHIDGAVSMARDEPGTGSAAYFFISIGDNTSLDYGGSRNPDGQGYAVFGQVVKGMDVVRAIQLRETKGPSESEVTSGQFLTEPVKIIQVKRK